MPSAPQDHRNVDVPGIVRSHVAAPGFHKIIADLQLGWSDPSLAPNLLFESAAAFVRPSTNGEDRMLLRHFERIGLAGDTNSKKCPFVDSGLDAGDGSITPRVGENPRADRHPVDVDKAGVRRNPCPRPQPDPGRDARPPAAPGLGPLRSDPVGL